MICWIAIGSYVISLCVLVWAVYTAPLISDDDPSWEEDEDYKAYAKEQVIKELEDIIIQHSNNNHIDKSHLENRIGDMRYDLKQK